MSDAAHITKALVGRVRDSLLAAVPVAIFPNTTLLSVFAGTVAAVNAYDFLKKDIKVGEKVSELLDKNHYTKKVKEFLSPGKLAGAFVVAATVGTGVNWANGDHFAEAVKDSFIRFPYNNAVAPALNAVNETGKKTGEAMSWVADTGVRIVLTQKSYDWLRNHTGAETRGGQYWFGRQVDGGAEWIDRTIQGPAAKRHLKL